jgi:hypothetical protein
VKSSLAIEACKGLWIVLKKVDRDTERQEAEAGHSQGRGQDQGRGGEEVDAEVEVAKCGRTKDKGTSHILKKKKTLPVKITQEQMGERQARHGEEATKNLVGELYHHQDYTHLSQT